MARRPRRFGPERSAGVGPSSLEMETALLHQEKLMGEGFWNSSTVLGMRVTWVVDSCQGDECGLRGAVLRRRPCRAHLGCGMRGWGGNACQRHARKCLLSPKIGMGTAKAGVQVLVVPWWQRVAAPAPAGLRNPCRKWEVAGCPCPCMLKCICSGQNAFPGRLLRAGASMQSPPLTLVVGFMVSRARAPA